MALPPLHFSIPGETTDTTACISFNSKQQGFNVCINDTPRHFGSLRQTYNYLRLMYGHEQAMAILELMAQHMHKCRVNSV